MKYKFEHVSFFMPLLAISLLCLLASSCGNQKFLKSHSASAERPRKRAFDEHMVVKNKLNFMKQSYKIQEDYDNLWYEISTIVQQTPDRSVVKGFRQWVHHLNDTLSLPYRYNKKEKRIGLDTINRKSNGLQKWLHTKVGTKPIILDTLLTKRTAESMQRFLNQKSYFDAKVTYEIKKVKHKAFVTYNIQTGMPLLIDTVFWYSKDSAMREILEDIKGVTLLKPRTPISLNNLADEKKRLTLAIRNRGYYDFNWNYIVVQADTANSKKVRAKKKPLFGGILEQGEPRAKTYLEVLSYSDTSVIHPQYKICNVYITPNEFLLKAHQKRKIKKDSFFIVERTLKNRQQKVLLKGQDIMQPNDVLLKEKVFKSGKKTRLVERSVPRFKKISLRSRIDILPNDRLVHIILRKIVRTKDGKQASLQEQRNTYFIRDKVISDAVSIRAGDFYNYNASQGSVRSINNLAVFRFPRIEYVPSSDGQEYCLDCLVKMQPGKKQEWGADFEVNNSESTVSSIGISTNLFYRNKNIFKGAEIFEVSVQGGVDFRIDSTATSNSNELFFNLIDVNAEASLYFPRFLGLKFFEKLFKMENSRTRVALGYRYLQQSTNFQISSFYTKMGYEWSRGLQHSFMWNPALINLTLEPNLDNDFAQKLAANNRPLFESLSASYLIPSMDFSYTFSSPETKTRGGAWFFKSYFEVAGNLVYLLDLAANLGPQPFFGVDYSQYFRTDFDIRYSFKINKRHSIISRFMLGIIIPYGNSEGLEVPFTKRFALGGPSSMRAWNLRYLGPGDQATVKGAEFQIGDLRIEFNSEYRFMFNSWIGGALFADIGNVWLLNSTSTVSDVPARNPKTGVFTEKFYEQLAIGAGLGLRVDVSFFIFRLDFALQLRDPQGYSLKDDGTVQYWNFDPFVLENRYKFIIAIGYPF
jgi:outer membrane protein assembly factor BamA